MKRCVIRIRNFLNSAIYFRNFASPWFLPWWTEYLNPNFSQSLPLNIVVRGLECSITKVLRFWSSSKIEVTLRKFSKQVLAFYQVWSIVSKILWTTITEAVEISRIYKESDRVIVEYYFHVFYGCKMQCNKIEGHALD